jgi:hypothetical protein
VTHHYQAPSADGHSTNIQAAKLQVRNET